jgi:hypothetical protein
MREKTPDIDGKVTWLFAFPIANHRANRVKRQSKELPDGAVPQGIRRVEACKDLKV